MKKLLIAICILSITTLTSCMKEDTKGCNQQLGNPQATATEITALQAYLTGAGITSAVQHTSGLYYIIISNGTGTVTPEQCSSVTVRYTGRLTNGNIFDQATTSPPTFSLYSLITGWRIGIPLIKTGGTVRLFIPPSLGYGDRAVGSIPANSILIFDIDLVAVN